MRDETTTRRQLVALGIGAALAVLVVVAVVLATGDDMGDGRDEDVGGSTGVDEREGTAGASPSDDEAGTGTSKAGGLDDLFLARHQRGPLEVRVPSDWAVERSSWHVGESPGRDVGPAVTASPDAAAFHRDAGERRWTTPGIFVSASTNLFLEHEGVGGEGDQLIESFEDTVVADDATRLRSCRRHDEGFRREIGPNGAVSWTQSLSRCGPDNAVIVNRWTLDPRRRTAVGVLLVLDQSQPELVDAILSSISYVREMTSEQIGTPADP